MIEAAATIPAITYIIQPPPITAFPTFLCIPAFVVGIPVALANFCFALVTPSARLQLKPGITDFLRLFAIIYSYL